MKQLLTALAFMLLSAGAVRADIAPPPPPPPPPGGAVAQVVAGGATTAALVLVGAWLMRSRRRAELRG